MEPMQQAQTSRMRGCAILVLITVAVLFVVDSRWWRDPFGRLRSLRNVAEVAWVLRPIDGPYPSPMSIDLGPFGDVWLTTKYDVYLFPGGDPGEPQVLLDPQIYREQFGRSMNALASAWLAPDGTLWVGSWEGEVLSWQDDRWREVVPESAGPSGKIAGLVVDDRGEEMWIGAHDGLWHSRDGGRTLELLAGLNSTVNCVTRLSDGRVAAGVWDEVYLGRGGEFRSVWRATDRGIAVEALAPRPGGGLLIGTRDGFVELTSDGREVGGELAGSYLTAFTNLDKPGQWVVATWGQGVFVETASGWHKLGFAEGLADDNLTDILVVNDRVWVGIYGEGVRSGTLTKLAELAESRSTG